MIAHDALLTYIQQYAYTLRKHLDGSAAQPEEKKEKAQKKVYSYAMPCFSVIILATIECQSSSRVLREHFRKETKRREYRKCKISSVTTRGRRNT